MVTAESVKAKLQGLIDTANAATGNADADLTAAVNALVAGFGQSGSANIPILADVTEYIHSEAWTSDALGNNLNFANTYCNWGDATDRYLYVAVVTNNTATVQASNGAISKRTNSGRYTAFYRNGAFDQQTPDPTSTRGCMISAGATVTVYRFYEPHEVVL